MMMSVFFVDMIIYMITMIMMITWIMMIIMEVETKATPVLEYFMILVMTMIRLLMIIMRGLLMTMVIHMIMWINVVIIMIMKMRMVMINFVMPLSDGSHNYETNILIMIEGFLIKNHCQYCHHLLIDLDHHDGWLTLLSMK